MARAEGTGTGLFICDAVRLRACTGFFPAATYRDIVERMKDMQAVRFNEKVKRLSTLIGAGGLALIVTALTRWLDRDPDLSILAWILTGAGFIFLSVKMNDLLESEDQQ